MKLLASAFLAVFALAVAEAAVAGEGVEYLYRLHCSGCHGADGTGSKVGRIPPFPGMVGHFADNPKGRLYLVHVPGIANAALPDAETANILNYVLHTWGGAGAGAKQDFSAEEVHSLRAVHVDDVAAFRHQLAVELAKQGVLMSY